MKLAHKASVRPSTADHRCPLASTHGASCMLAQGHRGPCYVAPIAEGEEISGAQFDQLVRGR